MSLAIGNHVFRAIDRASGTTAALAFDMTLMRSIRNRALFFAVVGFVVGAIAALVLPDVGVVQGLWGGSLGGLVGGAANACIRWMTRR